MKRLLSLLALLVPLLLCAQNNPVTSITISLPPNPDASLTKWGAGALTISASAKLLNGRVDPRVQESKILVTIKKSGGKVCGTYTSNSAPASNFNAATKVWSGNNAVSLLGQDCILPPGEYELSVQFFGAGPTGIAPISEEKSKAFSIKGNEQQVNYQPPQPIMPVDGATLSEADSKKPITFRWTPVIPRPQEPVTYRLRVWQLMQGQNSGQAIIQPPILGNDVGQLTQTTITNINSAPCKPPYTCDFIWNVQALNREGKPIGGNNGTSEAFKITVQDLNDRPSIITLLSPAKGRTISPSESLVFSWSHQWPPKGAPTFYKIKIVEIKGDESPENAMRGNKPFFERDSIELRNFQYPETASQFEQGKKYAWGIEAKRNPPYNAVKITESEINEFLVAPPSGSTRISLLAPSNKAVASSGEGIRFTWQPPTPSPLEGRYKIKIVEIKGDESPDNALRTNKPFFEKDSIGEKPTYFHTSAPKLQEGKTYAWNVQALNREGKPVGTNNGTSEAFTFNIAGKPAKPVLIAPANGAIIEQLPTFRWGTGDVPVPADYDGDGYYKIRIVEMTGDQSPENAIRGNKPHFEKDSLRPLSLKYPSYAPKLERGKRYAWNVQLCEECTDEPILEGKNYRPSETFTFRIASQERNEKQLRLVAPANGAVLNENPTFSWTFGPPRADHDGDGYYKIKIVEIKGDESPEQAFKGNKPHFEKDSIGEKHTYYPTSAPPLQSGKTYAWAVASNLVWSNVWIFKLRPSFPSCKDFKVTITKNEKTQTRDACCYDISISNNSKGSNAPTGFRVFVKDFSVVSASDIEKGWERTPAKFPASSAEIKWIKTRADIPAGRTVLGTICLREIKKDPFYLVYEWFDAKGKVLCKDSVQLSGCSIEGCRNDIIRNGGFVQGNNPGIMPSTGTILNWTNGYGTPTVNNDTAEGFIEKGYVKLSGNVSNGQAVAQLLNSNNKIIQGKKYKISVAVRFKSNENTTDYVRFRAIAFNGAISSGSGAHPAPSTDVAIIGRSGKIKDCGDWSVIELPVWTAGKGYSNIAINAFTNDNTNATVWIDNITTCESNQTGCDDVQTDGKGNPVTPAGYGNVPAGFTCLPEAENDEYLNGSLQDLYPGYDGTSSIYEQSKSDCFSVGGTLPEDANKYSCDDSLRAAGIDMTCEELKKLLQQDFIPAKTEELSLPPINSISDNKCDRPFPNAASMPFNGRDIIYIHGLQMSHIIDRANGQNGAAGQWPANRNEYSFGYYHNEAFFNMFPHINHFLRSRGHKNRFLIVSYDCSQSAELAVYTVLTQIREAMQNGTGVYVDSSDKRGTACFGRDYVFISHSTGALVADVALSIANKTKQPGALQTKYGNLGLISDRCKGRLSIQGAYSGSNLAKIACLGESIPGPLLTLAISKLTFTPLNFQSLLSNQNVIAKSILVDLTPNITRARWASYINEISVPVFTMAGGHPSAILGFLKYNIHPGFDDGVLTMDCANANNNPLTLGPSNFSASAVKVFDMGIPVQRAIKYYQDSRISEGVFAAASTAYLSPTGMVQPVTSINLNPQQHFKNHFSFVQSSKEHWFNATEPHYSGNAPCDYGKTMGGNAVNNEEQLVVTDPSLFAPGLIDPSILSKMEESIRGKYIFYPTIKIIWRRGIPRPTVYWKQYYIWKRTYHKLNDNCQYDVDYGYNYLFKQ